jgi:hypothetical protein
VVAARRPILGRVRVARHFAGLTGKSLTAVILVDVVEDRFGSVRSILNPDKLAFAASQGQQLSRARGPSGHCL